MHRKGRVIGLKISLIAELRSRFTENSKSEFVLPIPTVIRIVELSLGSLRTSARHGAPSGDANAESALMSPFLPHPEERHGCVFRRMP